MPGECVVIRQPFRYRATRRRDRLHGAVPVPHHCPGSRLPDLSAPLANLDQPGANATISGTATLSGWAFDNVSLAAVNIYVDGAAMGSATLGQARPDVASAYPNVAPSDAGWTCALDTTKLGNGPHAIEVHAVDSAANEAINAPVAVTVSN